MKSDEEIMELLEAFDLVGSYPGAAELAGADHHTVARYVALRDAGRAPAAGLHRAPGRRHPRRGSGQTSPCPPGGAGPPLP